MGDEYLGHEFKLGSTVRLERVEPDGIHHYENMDGATQYVDTRDARRLTKQEIWARLVSKRLTHA